MTSSIKSLGIDRLEISERLRLVAEIWDSVATDPTAVPVPEWHLDEVSRRRDAFATDLNLGRPAGESLADIKRRL